MPTIKFVGRTFLGWPCLRIFLDLKVFFFSKWTVSAHLSNTLDFPIKRFWYKTASAHLSNTLYFLIKRFWYKTAIAHLSNSLDFLMKLFGYKISKRNMNEYLHCLFLHSLLSSSTSKLYCNNDRILAKECVLLSKILILILRP